MNNDFWASRTGFKLVDLEEAAGIQHNEGDVERINQWHRKARKKTGFDATYVRFYHGTDPSLPIEDEGLKPGCLSRKKSLQSSSGYVYLATSPDMARVFGELGNSGKCTVYEVIVPAHRMLPDLDQLYNKRAANPDLTIGLTLGDSLFYGGGMRVRGSIEPWAIARFEPMETTQALSM